MAQTLAQAGFLQNFIDQRPVGFVGVGIGQGIQNLLVIDKFLRFHGFGIIHGINSFLVG